MSGFLTQNYYKHALFSSTPEGLAGMTSCLPIPWISYDSFLPPPLDATSISFEIFMRLNGALLRHCPSNTMCCACTTWNFVLECCFQNFWTLLHLSVNSAGRALTATPVLPK